MADPLYDLIATTGVIVPDTSELLAAVREEWRAALGEEMSVDPETPQGRLISAEVLAREAVVKNNVKLANQINPNMAGGVFLDAIMALTGGTRRRATQSLARGVQLLGYPGTIIPSGSLASTGLAGDSVWESLSTVVLDGAGTASVDFQATEYGPLMAASGEINTVVSSVLGWEQVSNPAPASPGTAEESDLAARQRRRLTLALQGVALPEAVISGLMDVDGVRSLVFRENFTNASVTEDGVVLAPHSIYVSVDGGLDADVARTLLERKSLGCAWNGGTVVPVTDPSSGQVYNVRFDRPAPIWIFIKVTIRQAGSVSDVATAVRNAILRYAEGGQDGEVGFAAGQDVSSFEIAGAVARELPGVYIQAVALGLSAGALNLATVNILINQIAATAAGFIEVEVLP